jgi:hypothetical protein
MRRSKRTARIREDAKANKERKTFTLSRESIALLNDLRAARRGPHHRSVSAVLDELLRALDKQRKREAIDQAVTSFYNGLSPEMHAEEQEWGEFSLAQFMDGLG